MKYGMAQSTNIVLCPIGIFDSPYIFGNFAPQFPEKHRRNRRRWRILCSFIDAESSPIAKMRKLKTNIIYPGQRLSFATGFAAFLVHTQRAHAVCKVKRAQ